MNRTYNSITSLFASVLVALGAVSCSQELEDPAVAGKPELPVVVNDAEGAVKGEILIKFKPEVEKMLDDAGVTRAIGSNAAASSVSGVPSVDEVLKIFGTYNVERVFPLDRSAEARSRKSGLHLWYHVSFDESADLEQVAKDLSRLGEISKIEFNHEIKRNVSAKPVPVAAVQKSSSPRISTYPAFDDPQLGKQWHFINDGDTDFLANLVAGADVNCDEAWKICTGNPEIIVAVLDEGIDITHPDLQANLWVNEDEIYRSNEDNDGNGYAGDVYGYNFSRMSGVITCDNTTDVGHGTHVAGTIAAVNNNGIGVCGIAGGDGTPGSGVKLMSIQTFCGNYGTSDLNQARGIKYAADNGAVILQCSWGYVSPEANPLMYGRVGPGTDEAYKAAAPLMVEAFDYFIYNAGSPDGPIDGGVVIFASGNENAAESGYPAAYGDYISVSAMTGDFTPASYTNWGPTVDVTAPGGDAHYHQSSEGAVLSTLPVHMGSYGYLEGTSMACPHVSGVAALGLSYAARIGKHFTGTEYRDLILKSVRNIDEHLVGQKLFYYNYNFVGDTHPELVDIGRIYNGKMGRGYIDAKLMLENVAGMGRDLILSNVYMQAGESRDVNFAGCFKGGSSDSYTVSVGDTSVATAEIAGGKVRIKANANGRTVYTVKSSSGESHEAYITVRDNAGGNGWL